MNTHTIKKIIRLFCRKTTSMMPKTIIGDHKNARWEQQGMTSEWEFKNTRLNRALNYDNFF